ncbi:MAG: DegT/DnrJ/EryC1/StrS family aminotransferase, partial [Bacteroidota bacterium]
HTDGLPNGTIAEASFFSSQWNKPFSTGIGGFVYARDPVIVSRLLDIEKSLSQPSFKDQLQLKAMISARNYLNNSSAYWFAVKTYRWLTKKGLVIGSSDEIELNEPVMPKDYLKAMSAVQMKYGIRQLAHMDEFIARRIFIANRYTEFLSGENITVLFIPENAEHTFLKYPLRVTNRELFFERAQRAKVEIGDWFISPIHPVVKNLYRWNYEQGLYPVADYISRHIVNLPTNPAMQDADIERVVSFLGANRELLIR